MNLLAYDVLMVRKRRVVLDRVARAHLKRLHCEVFTIPGELLSHVRQMRVRVAAPPLTVSEFAQPRARLRNVRAVITAAASGRP